MIITRNGNLMPSVFFGSAGHVMYVVLTFVPTISRTKLWMSLSVMRLMCPFRTFLSHICNGLLPILYNIDRNPDWNVFLNIFSLFLIDLSAVDERTKIDRSSILFRLMFLFDSFAVTNATRRYRQMSNSETSKRLSQWMRSRTHLLRWSENELLIVVEICDTVHRNGQWVFKWNK